ncbi:uncharacterized protein [Lolium perenne]|uniref:uncharacterized protein n=1 Tax=Lolium perenne TaxID=4522 RepID=UPI0021F669DE|nr:uncharacterized protein LOC127342283 [Lolium perenne]
MARRRYDYRWKEVQIINGYAVLLAYMIFSIRGIGLLVVTWTTVVLLGGFVSMIDEHDFWRLTVITLVQILWINASFLERMTSVWDMDSSSKTVKNLMTRKWQLANKARGGHPKLAVIQRVVAAVRVVVGWVLAVIHNVLLNLCILSAASLFAFGLLVTTSISIYGLVKHDYYGEDGDRRNMYPAHNVLYVLCVAQGAVFLYIFVLFRWEKTIVNQVSQAYGFQDGDRVVMNYCEETRWECNTKPSSADKRNLITYAIELVESKSSSSCLSGTLILDRLLTRQYSDKIKAPTLMEQEEEKQRQRQQQLQKQKRLDLEGKAEAQLIEKEEAKEEGRKSMEERKKREERRKKRQQREEAIIAQQRTVIKRLIGSASSTHILQKLLRTLDSRRSYDKKIREAAARIVEHVASGIRLEQFPGGINNISSLIDNFEEYRRLQPDESASLTSNTDEATTATVPPSSNTDENNGDEEEQGSYSSSESESEPEPEPESESEPASEYSESEPESESYNGISRPLSSNKPLNGYKDLVLTGLSILWRLAGSEDNCIIINNTKHLVSKIMAPVSYDLVHRTHHSAWSTSVVEASMKVMLRLIATAKNTNGDTAADLCRQTSNKGAITTMEKIVTCEECKGGELQMTAMQILVQLGRCSFTKMLVDLFIKGNCSDVSIRKTAGKELVLLFLDSKSVAALLPKEENDEFVDGLAELVSQVGNDNECRKSAAEILEHMCIHYTENDKYLRCQKEENAEKLRERKENDDYLSTIKNAMASAMPKVLREIIFDHGLTGEEGKPGYIRPDTDIESQVATDGKIDENKNNNVSSSHWQNQYNKLYVALMSLYVTACEKLELDIDAISPGEGDEGEGVAFRFAMQMVQLSRDRVSADSLTVIKLSTRIVIATMMKLQGTDCRAVKSAELERLIDSLTSVSDAMLDLEGSMIFTNGMMAIPATDGTLDSLVKEAQKLHHKIKSQDSGNNVS